MNVVPKIQRAGIYHNKPGGEIDHSEPQEGYLSTNLILSGSVRVRVGGPGLPGMVPSTHSAGEAFVWREGDTMYGHCGDEGMVSVFARFNWPGWQPRKTNRRHEIAVPRRLRISLPALNEMRYAYYQMIEAYQTKLRGWEQFAVSYLRLIFTIMHAESLRGQLSGTAPANPAIDRRLRLAVEFMEQHLRKAISIGEIAEYASLSEDYFRRLFARQMGMKPVQFLEQLRVKEAKRLIAEDPGLAVGEAGRQAGFADQRYFCRVFKRHYGIPPGEYRKSLSGVASVR
jgi:AraC-like DNA-binding protein